MNDPSIEQESLKIDLSDIEVEEIEVLTQEGGRGLPELAASCTANCSTAMSCTADG